MIPVKKLNSTLRRERKRDWHTVEQITYRAFLDFPVDLPDNGTEAALVRRMRSVPAFVRELDFVAEEDERIIGNIMYTKSRIVSDKDEWETLTFGPVSVLPKYQKQGVGSALIRHTLKLAQDMGFRAVLIYGHESYYPRFSFKPASEYDITTAKGESFPAFMALPLYDGALSGVSGRLICDPVYEAVSKAEADAVNAELAAPMDTDEYIAAQTKELQPILEQIRQTIRAAAPNAVERMSWQMPTFWQGENLIHFSVSSKHIGLYPGDEAVAAFAERLGGYSYSKGTIRLPIDKPIDYDLIADITRWRVAQVEAKNG
jgi:predicted N-acetyltransferase YhbS/uncharacterized protein YdhG (YjbR/CyaY superfamily)